MLIDFLERSFFKKKKDRSIFTSLMIDLAAILMWRGVWGLLDLYVFPNHAELSFVVSAFAGLILLILIKIISDSNHRGVR